MIEPLFDTLSELEVLARLAGSAVTDGYSIAQATFKSLGGTDFDKFLSDGLLEGSEYKAVQLKAEPAKVAAALNVDELTAVELNAGALEIRFKPSSHAGDGRYANTTMAG